ncbi:TrmH family RNA methyltransferase [Paenibacillus endoradicis]|uniref:TrmH family RNA methyltransferase n=1 Tax=Paenibacillus endoradicis TaxID=2972487 RepID=UPI002158CE14|nr:RNA methyltransferase [Paenibacillus endoradicis]MCR8657788.1 RNA methyltransferase [Paenibacillus endoradicis]
MTREHLLLSSVANERVKLWSSLLEKKHRDRQNMFIIEGIHLIKEAVKSGVAIEAIVYDADRGLPTEISTIMEQVPSYTEWYKASKQVMSKCTGTESAPPIFAVLGKFKISEEALYEKNGLVVVLDGVRDPGNVGTIIRSSDAVGANAVILGKGCVDLYNPKTVRSTMGSLFHIPIVEGDLIPYIQKAKEQGIHIVGTSLQATDNCYSYNWQDGSWLVMGSEGDGLSSEVEALVNKTIIIPMEGNSESLNVAMATTVLLYEALRQRKFN